MSQQTSASERTAGPHPGDPSPAMGVRVFGGVQVTGADGPVKLRGPRLRRLLTLLALRCGTVASADWLAEHLWHNGERSETSSASLRTCVSRLRHALPDELRGWIRTEHTGYRLDVPAHMLDYLHFAQLRDEATTARRRGDHPAALRLLDDALGLWQGEPFQEIDNSPVAAAEIEQLRIDRLEMLEERWECALALGRHTQITGELAVFTSKHQFRCRATRQYALALHRSGRTAEGLRAIADHRRFLVDETGLEPSTEIIALEQAMLAGDTALERQNVGQSPPRYQFLDEIGGGAFSIVWRANQLAIGREVAVKQIRSELAVEPELMHQFETEARLLASVQHPNVVPAIDFWRDQDSAYLVMGLLRGGTLENKLTDGPLTVEDTIELASQIGSALAAVHDRGIVHRDVKPGNIMFDEAGNAFLGDFGIALVGAELSDAAALSTGSPAYSAPEQLSRQTPGPRADIFSLGMVLIECLTATTRDHRDAQTSAVHMLGPNVPDHLVDALATATAAAPSDRFLTVAEFVAALQQQTGSASTPTNPPMRLRIVTSGHPHDLPTRSAHVLPAPL